MITLDDGAGHARRALGTVGVQLPNVPGAPPVPVALQRDAVRALERAGWPAAWVNEGVGGKDVFVQLALLLSATERITFGTGVANIWARPPQTAHGAAATLADTFPGRLVLGLGVGYPFQAEQVGARFDRPLAILRDYLDRMPEPIEMTPAPVAPYPRVVAASGPRMVELAARHADGVLTVLVPPHHTAHLRSALGPAPLLTVGISAVVDDDRERARSAAAAFVSHVVARPGSPYGAHLVRLGYAPADLEAGAGAVVDDIVAHGGPADVLAAVRRHLDAGADHVRLSLVAPDFDSGIARALELAPTLVGVPAAPAR